MTVFLKVCQVMQNRRNVSVRHDESITRPVREQCERCMCNDGMLEECAMLAGVNCSAGRGQATCRSNNRDLMDGEARSVMFIGTNIQFIQLLNCYCF